MNVAEEERLEDYWRSSRDVVMLLDAAAAISSKSQVEQVAGEAARQIARFLGADLCSISRWDQEANLVDLWALYAAEGKSGHPETHHPHELAEFPLSLKVLEGSQPAQVRPDDPQADPAETGLMLKLGAKSMLMVPLLALERTIGLIEIFDKQEARLFSAEEIALAQLLAYHAGIAIERIRVVEGAQRRAAELEALRQASLSLTASLDLKHVLNAILVSTLGLLGDALDAHIFLYDGERLTFGAALWADGRQGEPWANPRQDGLTYNVARQGEMLVVPDVQNHPLYETAPQDWRGSIIGIPLRIRERVVGVMNIAYQKPRQFSDAELRVINLLADQAAIAIENARLHRLVRQQALTDSLTGLPNRRAFNQRLEEEVRRSNRYHHSCALIMMDFDGFKRVNDTYGHLMGDQTLQMIGVCLLHAVRDTDFLARWGGDEFALLLPETSPAEAEGVGKKLRSAIVRCSFEWLASDENMLTLSLGIANFPHNAADAAELVKAADEALYRSKRNGTPD